jgi:hypothetical protein
MRATFTVRDHIDAAANEIRRALYGGLLPRGYARGEPLVWQLLVTGDIRSSLRSFGIDPDDNPQTTAALEHLFGPEGDHA